MKAVVPLALAAAFVACAPTVTPSVTSIVLRGADGSQIPLDAVLREHPITVITFFSAHCPCQRAHDDRLRELIAKDASRGVGFLVVDSEESASPEEEKEEARIRRYPIALDDQGRLARAVDAEYATYSVVVDGSGTVLYRGGFDSDKSHLRENRATYLADAVDDILEHHPLRRSEAKTLGCALQLR